MAPLLSFRNLYNSPLITCWP